MPKENLRMVSLSVSINLVLFWQEYQELAIWNVKKKELSDGSAKQLGNKSLAGYSKTVGSL